MSQTWEELQAEIADKLENPGPPPTAEQQAAINETLSKLAGTPGFVVIQVTKE